MGSYLNTEGDSLAKNPAAKRLIDQVRDKITLENLCMVFNAYMLEIYPKEDMTWEEFDNIFS